MAAKKTTAKRRGRPPKVETLERRLEAAQAEIERLRAPEPEPEPEEMQPPVSDEHEDALEDDADPFAGPVEPPPAVRRLSEAAEDGWPIAQEDEALGRLVVYEENDGKIPLGRERAEALYGQLVAIYNAVGADKFALSLSRKQLELLPVEEARTIWAELQEIAQLSEPEQEMLREPCLQRLEKMRVSQNVDLWLTVGFVFGLKAMAIKSRVKGATQNA